MDVMRLAVPRDRGVAFSGVRLASFSPLPSHRHRVHSGFSTAWTVLPECVGLFIVVLILAGPLQAAQQPPRAQQADRSGSIAGVVVSASTGSPMAGVQVRLGRVGDGGGELVRTTGTDGVFAFSGLASGRYWLSTTRAGYVPQFLGEAVVATGDAIDLASGQSRDGLRIALRRGGVIAGTLTDEHGEPLVDVTVGAVRVGYVDGIPQLQTGPRLALSNDIGEYRLFGLEPGEYYVLATLVTTTQTQGSGRGAGRGGGPGSLPPHVARAMAGSWSSSETSEESIWARIYYPGVPHPGGAAAVRVDPTQETRGVDFVLPRVPALHVAGTVRAPDGTPLPQGNVTLRPVGAAPVMELTAQISQGAFRFDAVAPAQYVVEVRRRPRPVSADSPVTLEFGATTVYVVEGQPLEGVEIAMSGGATVTGRVVREESGRDFGAPQLLVRASSPTDLPRDVTAVAPIGPDGRFEMHGVHDDALFIAAQLPQGWFLKDVTLNGRSIIDEPQSFPAGARIDGLELVLTDRLGGVEGTLEPRTDGNATSHVVLFSTDGTKWGPRSRFVRVLSVDGDGRFSARGLPDGEYVVAPVPPAQRGQETGTAWLTTNRDRGTRIRVTEDDVTHVVLRGQP